MINLTPHAIVIRTANGESITYPPSGTVARVEMTEVDDGSIDLSTTPDQEVWIPVIKRVSGVVTGLNIDTTEPVLVSSMVLSALQEMGGWEDYPAYAPDTGPTAIRGETGHIIAVTRLVAIG